MAFRDRGIEIKSPEQIDLMRVAGRLVGETLELLRGAVRPGVTTLELDTLAEANIRDHGGIPSFKGYSEPPFPATICASVNDEVVERLLQRAEIDGRADDTDDVIRRRQELYGEETAPLIEVYRDRGLLIGVDGMGEVEDVTTRIFDALDVVPQS